MTLESWAHADHPRVGGEHRSFLTPWEGIVGSSPRWRGAPSSAGNAEVQTRIIPALAGSTVRPRAGCRCCWDHPRVGGEHLIGFHCADQAAGSSPRWRGALLQDRRQDVAGGIIPALAGSTVSKPFERWSKPDHPRVGGEHMKLLINWKSTQGSSPRWRGAQHRARRAIDRHRIIPALAGSTSSKASAPLTPSDHPRVGGEHGGGLLRLVAERGIIPALAGSTDT